VVVLEVLVALKRSLDEQMAVVSSLICQLRGEEGGDPEVSMEAGEEMPQPQDIERLWVDLENEKQRNFALEILKALRSLIIEE
jgi:hypothetical protein